VFDGENDTSFALQSICWAADFSLLDEKIRKDRNAALFFAAIFPIVETYNIPT
jgi:hypothetical protein